MHYYNAKSKVIMNPEVRTLGGRGTFFGPVFAGGKRSFIKRTCRSKSRCGGAVNTQDPVFAGGKRSFRKRTCRSKSRCGGDMIRNTSKQSSAMKPQLNWIFQGGGGSRGVRGVRRSRRGGRGGRGYRDYLLF